jgi:hypothetical protein
MGVDAETRQNGLVRNFVRRLQCTATGITVTGKMPASIPSYTPAINYGAQGSLLNWGASPYNCPVFSYVPATATGCPTTIEYQFYLTGTGYSAGQIILDGDLPQTSMCWMNSGFFYLWAYIPSLSGVSFDLNVRASVPGYPALTASTLLTGFTFKSMTNNDFKQYATAFSCSPTWPNNLVYNLGDPPLCISQPNWNQTSL